MVPAMVAQDYNSTVKVRLADNSPIRIAIDQRQYAEEARTLTVDKLTPGRHRLRVYLVSGRNGRRSLVYDGYFRIERGTYSYIVVDRFKGTVRINSHLADRDDRYPDDPLNKDRYNDRNDRNDRHNGVKSFSRKDIDDLKTRVEERITDTDKLKLMKAVLGKKTYTTGQMKVMLHWLSFDSSKLELAKWGYKNVSDRTDYWKLESDFDFDASRNEFNDFISGQ